LIKAFVVIILGMESWGGYRGYLLGLIESLASGYLSAIMPISSLSRYGHRLAVIYGPVW
jgi:hypothetical protein